MHLLRTWPIQKKRVSKRGGKGGEFAQNNNLTGSVWRWACVPVVRHLMAEELFRYSRKTFVAFVSFKRHWLKMFPSCLTPHSYHCATTSSFNYTLTAFSWLKVLSFSDRKQCDLDLLLFCFLQFSWHSGQLLKHVWIFFIYLHFPQGRADAQQALGLAACCPNVSLETTFFVPRNKEMKLT